RQSSGVPVDSQRRNIAARPYCFNFVMRVFDRWRFFQGRNEFPRDLSVELVRCPLFSLGAEMSSKVQLFTVSEDEEGQRLDNYLVTRMKGVPKSALYRVIRKGEVRVNK